MFEEQKSVVDKVKWVWWFLKEELPQFLSNWKNRAKTYDGTLWSSIL